MSATGTASKSGAQKPRLSNDFLRVNRNYQAVIKVIETVLKAAGYNMMTEYVVMALTEFKAYTYVYSKKHFSSSHFMHPLIEALKRAEIETGMKDPDQRRFEVHLNITLKLAEQYFDEKLYKEAERLSPWYENNPLPPTAAPVMSVVTSDPAPEVEQSTPDATLVEPALPVEGEQLESGDEELEEDDSAEEERDDRLLEDLRVTHPLSILDASGPRKKEYLTDLVAERGDGIKLMWLQTPKSETKGWRIRDGSDRERHQELMELLTMWGYDISPGPLIGDGIVSPRKAYFLLNRLEPTEVADFFDDRRDAHRRKMEQLAAKTIDREVFVPTNELENVLVEKWREDMSAKELVMLLHKDIRALSKIANMAHLQEISARTVANEVMEALQQLNAVPIIEAKEVGFSGGEFFFTGRLVRQDVLLEMLTHRILYISLRNSLFSFRNDLEGK